MTTLTVPSSTLPILPVRIGALLKFSTPADTLKMVLEMTPRKNRVARRDDGRILATIYTDPSELREITARLQAMRSVDSYQVFDADTNPERLIKLVTRGILDHEEASLQCQAAGYTLAEVEQMLGTEAAWIEANPLKIREEKRVKTDGRFTTTFKMVSERRPLNSEVREAQLRLDYHPAGYGGPNKINSDIFQEGDEVLFETTWSCAGSCD